VGQDLQSGNLSQAQSDFDAIQPNNVPGLSSSSSSNDLASAFNQLATDLKSGKLSAAQQDYATVQQDLQSGNLSQAQSPYASPQQEFAQLGAAVTTSTAPSSNALNVSA
jgi:outer membrane protein assembly factor BamD (BamD/ComL family)